MHALWSMHPRTARLTSGPCSGIRIRAGCGSTPLEAISSKGGPFLGSELFEVTDLVGENFSISRCITKKDPSGRLYRGTVALPIPAAREVVRQRGEHGHLQDQVWRVMAFPVWPGRAPAGRNMDGMALAKSRQVPGNNARRSS